MSTSLSTTTSKITITKTSKSQWDTTPIENDKQLDGMFVSVYNLCVTYVTEALKLLKEEDADRSTITTTAVSPPVRRPRTAVVRRVSSSGGGNRTVCVRVDANLLQRHRAKKIRTQRSQSIPGYPVTSKQFPHSAYNRRTRTLSFESSLIAVTEETSEDLQDF